MQKRNKIGIFRLELSVCNEDTLSTHLSTTFWNNNFQKGPKSYQVEISCFLLLPFIEEYRIVNTDLRFQAGKSPREIKISTSTFIERIGGRTRNNNCTCIVEGLKTLRRASRNRVFASVDLLKKNNAVIEAIVI